MRSKVKYTHVEGSRDSIYRCMRCTTVMADSDAEVECMWEDEEEAMTEEDKEWLIQRLRAKDILPTPLTLSLSLSLCVVAWSATYNISQCMDCEENWECVVYVVFPD